MITKEQLDMITPSFWFTDKQRDALHVEFIKFVNTDSMYMNTVRRKDIENNLVSYFDIYMRGFFVCKSLVRNKAYETFEVVI
jgi:hypothetical protein